MEKKKFQWRCLLSVDQDVDGMSIKGIDLHLTIYAFSTHDPIKFYMSYFCNPSQVIERYM